MKTDQLIASLSHNNIARKSISFSRIILELLFVSLASLIIITLIYGLRQDISELLSARWFRLEIISNIVLLVTAVYSAASFAYPDRAGKRTYGVLLSALAFYFITIIFKLTSPETTSISEVHSHGFQCLACILSFAVIPALFLSWRLKHLATTHPSLLGTTCLLSAMAVGTLGVLLVESEVVNSGLMLWHYLPIFAFGLLGYIVGKKIFNW